MNGTSCAILISASSLSSVTIEGVAMMLVLPMPFSARIRAAQLVPFSFDLAEAQRRSPSAPPQSSRGSVRPAEISPMPCPFDGVQSRRPAVRCRRVGVRPPS
jgi:hypothetical protein